MRFGEATFTGRARFGGATFTGDARFGGATFISDARFDGTTFTGDALFDGVTFTGETWFGGATNRNGTNAFRFNECRITNREHRQDKWPEGWSVKAGSEYGTLQYKAADAPPTT